LNDDSVFSASRAAIIAVHLCRRDRAAKKNIATNFFGSAPAISSIAAALDCVYNQRALITIIQRKGTA